MNRALTSRRRKARNIRYHDHEWDRVVAHARVCGIPAATFVRKASLGAKPRARRNGIENELILRLGEVANELRRLVGFAARAENLSVLAKLDRALEETLAAVRKIG